VEQLHRGLVRREVSAVLVIFRSWKLMDSIVLVTGTKDHGAAGPVDLIFAGEAGCGRFTV
jgi:hypothetical protein